MIIVEHEENAVWLLKHLLEKVDTHAVIGELQIAYSIKEAEKMFQTYRFDVSFLDIQFEDEYIYDLLETASIEHLGTIFFTTGLETVFSKKYEKFKVHDIISKPYNLERISAVYKDILVEKQIGQDISEQYMMFKKVMDHFSDTLKQEHSYKYMFLKDNVGEKAQETVYLDDDTLYALESEKNYYRIYYEERKTRTHKKALVRGTLQEIYLELNPDVFVQCHKSYIINRNFITEAVKHSRSSGIFLLLFEETLGKLLTVPYSETFYQSLVDRKIFIRPGLKSQTIVGNRPTK